MAKERADGFVCPYCQHRPRDAEAEDQPIVWVGAAQFTERDVIEALQVHFDPDPDEEDQ